jgi:CheY-like chemotaxis protein
MARSILILEDEAVLRKHLCRIFERRGFDVCGVGSVAEFLEAARDLRYDTVLLDVSLPDGDGLEAWAIARALQGDAEAFVLTSQALAEVAPRARLLGVRTLLSKPVDLPALIGAVNARAGGGIPAA